MANVIFIDCTDAVPETDPRFESDEQEWYNGDAWGCDPDYLFSDGSTLMFETRGFFDETDKCAGKTEYIVCHDLDSWTDSDKACVSLLCEYLNDERSWLRMDKVPGFTRHEDKLKELGMGDESWHEFLPRKSKDGKRIIAYRGGRGYCYGVYREV